MSLGSLASRLKEVRKALGLTQEMVSRATGIGKWRLSQFESGKREPRLAQLRSLADCYRRPLSYFLRDEEPKAQPVLWRQRPDSPQQLEADLRNLAYQYHTLELIVEGRAVSHLREQFESIGCCPDEFTYRMAEGLACEVRNLLNLGDAPGGRLLDILEQKLGVKVFHLEFEPTGSAACTASEEYGSAILLNARSSRRRRNFDLAHELFHLLTWNSFRSAACDSTCASDREEKLANCFARNLLIPRDSLLRVWTSTHEPYPCSPIRICYLARYFDVSIEALGWQIKWVFDLDDGQANRLIERAKSMEPILGRPENDSPPVRPPRFERLAREALRAGLISVGKYAEFMGIPRRQAMEEYSRVLEADLQDNGESDPSTTERECGTEGSHP